jgi:hypothetical protein
MLWSEDVGPEMVDLSLFPDFVDEIHWIFVQDRMRMSSRWPATTICGSMLAAGLFIDSGNFVGDGDFFGYDKMVEARRLLERVYKRRSSFDERGKPYMCAPFRVLLQCFQDNFFLLSVSLHVYLFMHLIFYYQRNTGKKCFTFSASTWILLQGKIVVALSAGGGQIYVIQSLFCWNII